MPKFTLRKAKQIQDKIGTYLATPIVLEITPSKYQGTAEAIKAQRTPTVKRLEDSAKLAGIQYDIRAKIAVENAAKGVDALLAEAAKQSRIITLYEGAAKAKAAPDENAAQHYDDVLRTPRPETYYGERPTVIGILTQAEIDNFDKVVVMARRAKETAQDQLMTINASNTVDVSDADIEFLQDLGIL